LKILVIEDAASLAPHLAAWDALAVEREQPFCAPGWMLSWWRTAGHGRRTRLRVVLAHDERGRLVGVGPFFANMTYGLAEMRLLGAGFCHRIGVLAANGREHELAAPLAQALAAMRPRPASIVFEGVDGEDPWPRLIAASWPSRRRPGVRADGTMQAPVIRLEGSYEEWMERRERRFRKEARRQARRLEEQRVLGRIAGDGQAIDALLELHHARWTPRGGSNVDGTARGVLHDAAASMGAGERLIVAMLEAPSGPVAAELIVRAGATAVFWGGGFDPAWASQAPGTQAMLLALRTLAEQGVRTADLGGGAHPYKQRMADETTTLAWRTVFPPGWRHPLIRLRLAPKHARLGLRSAARRLPEPWRRRLTDARAALRRGRAT
jgi:CelD/BcsL family acetyltransferase involved in cellulose biosynthesis